MKFKIFLVLILLSACGKSSQSVVYHDPLMDFGAVQTVAFMPFANLTRDNLAAERVRNTMMSMFWATESFYVVPEGEVLRGISRTNIKNPIAPSTEEIIKFASMVKANAVLTGVVKEYGEIRSGSISSSVISVSLQMLETESGKVIWAVSSTKGGVTTVDRLFGGGGRAMNEITEKAVSDVINKLFN